MDANVVTTIFGLLIACIYALYHRGKRLRNDLKPIGFPTNLATFYIQSILNCFKADAMLKTAFDQHDGHPVIFPLLGHPVVCVKSREHVVNVCKAPEHVLSMEAAANELLQIPHIVGPRLCEEIDHITAIRTSLNRNLSEILPDMMDEMVSACEELLPRTLSGDWIAVNATPIFSRIICRMSARAFIGLPHCRNEDYLTLTQIFTNQIFRVGPVMKFLIPPFLRPAVGAVYRAFYGYHRRMMRCIVPILEERMRNGGDNQPNDMLTWLMHTATKRNTSATSPDPSSPESIAWKMLNVNYVAIHSPTTTFLHALYHLASQAQPIYQHTLFAETTSHLNPNQPRSWTREALESCIHLDSFVKETLRLNGQGALWMPRLAMRGFSFTDPNGASVIVPKGHYVAIAASAVHHDPEVYERPMEFDGFRFARMRTEMRMRDGEVDNNMHMDDDISTEMREYDMTAPNPSYVAFGGGRHVCPGRFFAALQLKALLAFLVMKYEVRMGNDGVRPSDSWFGPIRSPARDVTILVRERG